MLTFSTLFPVNEQADGEAIRTVVQKWLIGSPHSEFSAPIGLSETAESQYEARIGRELIRVIATAEGPISHIGIRYEKAEPEGMTWTTEVVHERTTTTNQISIQVHCESASTTLQLPPARKPYLVRQILAEIGGGPDGSLQVSDEPIVLSNADIEFAADIVNGNSGNRLPVVYLSATSGDHTMVPPDRLAHWLSGIAHVVVEPNREFSFRLMHEVDHQNTYGGAAGLYWPDRSAKVLLLPRDYDFDPKAISAEISHLIRNRSVRLRMPRSMTWSYLTEIAAKRQIDKLRSAGSRDIQEYIENFDTELRAKNEALREAEDEIRRLEAELYGLRAKNRQIEGVPVLVRGIEQDLYADEALDILLDVLDKGLTDSLENSRRAHVLKSIIVANVGSGSRAELMGNIKSLLSNYRKLETSVEHELEEMGFEVSSEGKHYKVTFKGDARYAFTMPKTSSDHRAGKNMVSQINGLIF